jgi:predicted nuclease of predicted toxin-antitoxin system
LTSKDDDFVRLFLREPTARLIWVRVGNCRRGALLDVFRRVWPDIVERIEKQDRFIEVR